MKTLNSLLWTSLLLFILNIHSEQALAQFFNDCQNAELSGKYVLISDSDGKTPKDGTIITLTLFGNSATINAKMPDNEIISGGTFYACNNIISISFSDFDFDADKKPFNISGNTLSLPFKVLGDDGEGSSVWNKIQSNNIADNLVGNTTIDPFSGVSSDIDPLNNQNRNNSEENNLNVKESVDNEDSEKGESQNKNNDKPENAPNNRRSTKNQYVGDYIGTGWGWEVRFKHNSGDFVSQFTGTKKNELPFDGDKIIMSLLVEHVAKYKIHIDENNQLTGEGEIVYNVIPNLCGLAVLTEQVNAAVNLMSEFVFFFDLGRNIAKKSVESFTGKFLGMQGNLAKSVKIATETGGKLINSYIGMKLTQKMKALDLEGQQNNALCNCAAGHAAITAGNKVGPSTIKEMIKTTGVDVAKALFMDMATGSLPVGMILSIPGVTQVQYEYKGLQNGPETRKFKIKGYLADGRLYLQMDGDVFDGPKDLTIEYTVNYKTERPTFPTWSPFLKDAGEMFPAGSEATLYKQIEKIKTFDYKDDATGTIKTMEVPFVETIEMKETLPFPFATYRKAGKQRNGVKVWHEYEYNWTVYKIPANK